MSELRLPHINFIILSGRLVDDPKLMHLPSGKPVVNFRIASTRRFQVNGEWREETLFINCVYLSKGAEDIAKRLSKGKAIVVEGRLRYREWEDPGTGSRRNTYEIVVYRVHSLEKLRSEEEPIVELPKEDIIEGAPDINFDEDDNLDEDLPF